MPWVLVGLCSAFCDEPMFDRQARYSFCHAIPVSISWRNAGGGGSLVAATRCVRRKCSWPQRRRSLDLMTDRAAKAG